VCNWIGLSLVVDSDSTEFGGQWLDDWKSWYNFDKWIFWSDFRFHFVEQEIFNWLFRKFVESCTLLMERSLIFSFSTDISAHNIFFLQRFPNNFPEWWIFSNEKPD
jgi:hypothetical protein